MNSPSRNPAGRPGPLSASAAPDVPTKQDGPGLRRGDDVIGMMPYTTQITATPDDIDELGHVNNAVWVSWIQDVAVAHWRRSRRRSSKPPISGS